MLAVGVIVAVVWISESEMPGHGFGSRVLYSSEITTAARIAEENRIKAKEEAEARRVAEYNERVRVANVAAEKRGAENEILRRSLWKSTSKPPKPLCPDPEKWAALGSEYHRSWHEILSSRNLPRIGENCYLE